MIVPRRLLLQLTPLLDLLLIVIFAQYMEVRDRQAGVSQELSAAQVAVEDAWDETRQVQIQSETLRQAAELAERNEAVARQELETVREQLQASERNLDRALDQQRVIGELIVELFNLPEDRVRELLSADRLPTETATNEDVERIREQFREFSQQRAGRMIEHLLSYEEIRKRCDVWDLHIDAQGVLTLTAGERVLSFPIETDDRGNVLVERLVSRIFNWYRTLPQPKSLVVILLTYDRRAPLGFIEPAQEALGELVRRLQGDASGRIRFEYADLGFRIEP